MIHLLRRAIGELEHKCRPARGLFGLPHRRMEIANLQLDGGASSSLSADGVEAAKATTPAESQGRCEEGTGGSGHVSGIGRVYPRLRADAWVAPRLSWRARMSAGPPGTVPPKKRSIPYSSELLG